MIPQRNNGNLFNTISQLMGQAGANPQAFVNNILRNNPKFAQQLRGQNLQEMAMNMMSKRGIDISQLKQFIDNFTRK